MRAPRRLHGAVANPLGCSRRTRPRRLDRVGASCSLDQRLVATPTHFIHLLRREHCLSELRFSFREPSTARSATPSRPSSHLPPARTGLISSQADISKIWIEQSGIVRHVVSSTSTPSSTTSLWFYTRYPTATTATCTVTQVECDIWRWTWPGPLEMFGTNAGGSNMGVRFESRSLGYRFMVSSSEGWEAMAGNIRCWYGEC